MKIQIRNDKVEIEGYVNAIERNSKPIRSRSGRFVERIKKGAFRRALERADDVRLLLNHDWKKDLGGLKDGNLELTEDAIGLKARAEITDPEVIEKAKNGDLVGWSFGFKDRPGGSQTRDENGMPTREVSDLNLYEVSLLDRSRSPAYEGTLVTVRSEDGEDESIYYGETFESDVEIRAEEEKSPGEAKPAPADPPAPAPENVPKQQTPPPVVDYTKYENLIAEMKGAYEQ